MNSLINIKFDELSYSVEEIFFKDRKKEILKRISGNFYGSELTAILGPSGSGKSTLMNLLFGFEQKYVCGTISMNGCSINKFRRNIVYITQENNLQPLLTVGESMNFAIKFKIGNQMNSFKKWIKIAEILKSFGLFEVESEYVKNLSGGQQKRLSIALEIVDDPKVIFLDEPTTGLDSVSSTICINLMRQLAQEGKTVVCTIHQPTTNQLKSFSHLYILANGECAYQGNGKNLVPFLSELNLICPSTFNPADFLLETVTGIYGQEHISKLIEKIDNGKNENFRTKKSIEIDDSDSLEAVAIYNSSTYSPSFLSKFNDLLVRNFIIMFRDKSLFKIRMFMHIMTGLLLGLLYYDIGNDAQNIIDNFRLIFVALSFLTYTAYYSIMVAFPLNFSSVRRETFNRWYTPSIFYINLILTDLPTLILGIFAFILPMYYLTSQPLEFLRFATFSLIMTLNSICSQAFGLIAGSFAGLKQTLILAPVFMIFHGAFSGFYILKKDAHSIWHPFFEISYLKYAAYGSEMSILGFNRTKMECNAIYCHYSSPGKFLQTLEYASDMNDFITCVFMLVVNSIINFIFAYFLIKRRLKTK
ncbi:hypothetical protein PVAND_001836 [Polypedilum vanderplanki]|uniref:ABC transporter domain-containing protein n=1 Tax=Polypedilum vanderplanki TaxID=319348 RepID=A0A9J6BPL4_POLVA|nr:hypothetical protein PVAND_001836 [Polypedilum vanderplanki]